MGDHLRQQQAKLSSFTIGAVVGRGRRPGVMLRRWPDSTSRAQLAAPLTDDPDEIPVRFGPRSAMRKLEIQAARCDVQRLDAQTALACVRSL